MSLDMTFSITHTSFPTRAIFSPASLFYRTSDLLTIKILRSKEEIQGIDFVEAREQEQALSDQQTELSRKLIAWENSNVLSDLQLKLREAKLERDTLESQNRVHRQNQSAGKPDTRAMAKTISSERMRLETLKTLTDGVRKEIDSYQKDIAAGREEWIRVNGEAFTGGICPTCGQALPFEQLQQATQSFDERKKQRLQGILEKGNQAKESCSIAQQRLKELETEIRDREGQIQALVEQLEAVKSSTVVVTDLPEYAEQMQAIQEKCSSLQAEIQRVMQDNAKEQNAIRVQLTAVNDQLRLVRGVIAKESVKERTMDRIAQLKADAKNAAEALEAIEKMLRRQYKAKVTAKTVDKMASKKASQRARVADLADKLLDKLEQAIDELDLRTTAYKVKTVDGNREEVVEYQEATQGGVVSRAGLRQLTAALKDLKEVKDIVSELDKKEQEARIAALQSRSVTVDDDEDETGVILLPPRLEGTDHG